MYHYVRNADFLAGSYSYCANLVNQLVQHLRRYEIHGKAVTLGNRKRGLVVQNEKDTVHYEFYLILQNTDAFRPRDLKEQIINAFNEILDRNWLPNCEDTPFFISTKPMLRTKRSRTKFQIDLTLITIDEDNLWHRLIHFKTEDITFDEWYWYPVPYSDKMKEMEYYLKPKHSLRLRRKYLEQKNNCVGRSGHECPSLISYLEALHQVYEWALEKEKKQSNDCP